MKCPNQLLRREKVEEEEDEPSLRGCGAAAEVQGVAERGGRGPSATPCQRLGDMLPNERRMAPRVAKR